MIGTPKHISRHPLENTVTFTLSFKRNESLYINPQFTHSLTHLLNYSFVRIMLLYPIWSLFRVPGMFFTWENSGSYETCMGASWWWMRLREQKIKIILMWKQGNYRQKHWKIMDIEIILYPCRNCSSRVSEKKTLNKS